MALLVAIPFVQLLLLRWTHRQFTRRFGRPPADAPGPPIGLNVAPYLFGAWRYSREDLRYAALTTLIAMCPLFFLLPFFRAGA
jgi:hypothetical protein